MSRMSHLMHAYYDNLRLSTLEWNILCYTYKSNCLASLTRNSPDNDQAYQLSQAVHIIVGPLKPFNTTVCCDAMQSSAPWLPRGACLSDNCTSHWCCSSSLVYNKQLRVTSKGNICSIKYFHVRCLCPFILFFFTQWFFIVCIDCIYRL